MTATNTQRSTSRSARDARGSHVGRLALVPPPLTGEEVEHYRWIVDGLLRGLSARAVGRSDEVAIRAFETLRDIFDEFLARVEPPLAEPPAV